MLLTAFCVLFDLLLYAVDCAVYSVDCGVSCLLFAVDCVVVVFAYSCMLLTVFTH